MKIKQRIGIVIVSALATFGILFATLGKPDYTKCHAGMHHRHCTEMKAKNQEKISDFNK
jgi:hypothetical protein